jgi:hypothetical protein
MEKQMAAKKAAKKIAKKAAKKGAKHHGDKHDAGKDLRRAYEHMGRLTALGDVLSSATVKEVAVLTRLAEVHLQVGNGKNAAHLLRAGEHLAFGSLASTAKASRLSEELEEAIHSQYEHMMDKADEHWTDGDARSGEITSIYESMNSLAETAYRKGAFRRALEFARGAEALAHVKDVGENLLGEGDTPSRKKLK